MQKILFILFFWAVAFDFSLEAAMPPSLSAEVIKFQADTYTTNLETRKTEVEGNVRIEFGDRELFADKLSIDSEGGDVECKGKVLYRKGTLEIEAEGVKFNLKTGLGTFYNAVVRNPGAFHLEGKEVFRESEDVYVAKVAKISFCQDCPQAWSLVGDKIRVNTERYAEIHHALLEIKDVPILYLPLVYYPAKDRRFSGFLIPYFRYSKALGAQVGIPFFWAPSDSLDFTWDYRYMSTGGHRNAVETRLQLSDYSYWRSDMSWVRSLQNTPWMKDRYGLHYGGRFQLISNWALLMKGDLVSDVEMSRNFEDDSRESRLPNYSNNFFIDSQYENFSLFGGVRLPQDNLERKLTTRGDVNWTLPQVKAGIPLTPLYDSFLASVRIEDLGVRRFQNGSTTHLLSHDPASNAIASGDRYSGLVDLSLPLNFKYLRSTSRVHLRGDYYHFVKSISPTSASRARVVMEQNLEVDFFKVWKMGWNDMPRMKHIVTPYVGFSYSPEESRSNHGFFNNTSDPRFDLFDGGTTSETVRLGTEELEARLKKHTIATYGFKTQFLGYMAASQEIREIFYLDLGQEYNLIDKKIGRLKLYASGNYSGFTLSSQIAWDIEKSQVDLLNALTWEQRLFRLSLVQSIRPEADNIGGELKIKNLGPFEVATQYNYDRQLGKLIEQIYYLSYNSLSKCWRFDMGLKRRLGDSEFEYAPSIQVTYSEGVKDRSNFEP